MNISDFANIISLFSTRELALAFWLLVFLAICLCIFLNDESFRESIVDIFKSLCTRPLNVVISLMVLYCVLITFLFSKCAIWKIRYLKDIILWFSFGGTLFVFNSLDDSNEENYIMDYLKDCLSFSVIVGFIFDSFTFNIFIELILMLIIIVLAIFKCTEES